MQRDCAAQQQLYTMRTKTSKLKVSATLVENYCSCAFNNRESVRSFHFLDFIVVNTAPSLFYSKNLKRCFYALHFHIFLNPANSFLTSLCYERLRLGWPSFGDWTSDTVPLPRESFGGLSFPNKVPTPQTEIWNTINQWSSNFQNFKPTYINVKPPYWRLSGDNSDPKLLCEKEWF